VVQDTYDRRDMGELFQRNLTRFTIMEYKRTVHDLHPRSTRNHDVTILTETYIYTEQRYLPYASDNFR
jgi:hypothetical protein